MAGVHLWDQALSLLYPPVCCGCAESLARPGFCRRCQDRIRMPQTPLCSICGVPFGTRTGADHACGNCLAHRRAFDRARACAIYDAAASGHDPLKSTLQRYKYTPEIRLAGALGELLVQRCPYPLAAYDVIMPVPLHVTRLRWRGFNQAQFLARGLARAARLPLDALSVQRIRPTLPQVELNEAQRRRNVARAFRVTRPHRVSDRRILLIDDVYTTGATVDECSRALRRAGARAVDVLVLARAVLH